MISKSFTDNYNVGLIIPSVVTPEYWNRHSYSEMDILLTLRAQTGGTLVKMCALLGIQIPTPCIKPCISSSDVFMFTNKNTALHRVCDMIKKNFNFSAENKLHAGTLIPTHSVDSVQFKSVLDNISQTPVSFVSMNEFKTAHDMLGVLWIPYSQIDDDIVHMKRIIPFDTFDKNLKKHIIRSFLVSIDGVVYISTDENMFICM